MLYEEDYLAWTQQQIDLLQTGKLEELVWATSDSL